MSVRPSGPAQTSPAQPAIRDCPNHHLLPGLRVMGNGMGRERGCAADTAGGWYLREGQFALPIPVLTLPRAWS